MLVVGWLRSLLFYVGLIAATFVFGSLSLLVLPLSLERRQRFVGCWIRFVLWWLRWSCGIRYEVEGLDRLPSPGPAVVLSKHQSAWETIALQHILPPHAIVIKRELLWLPFFGWGMAGLEPISLDRSRGQQALQRVLKQGQEKLGQGRWVTIFPEGSRVPTGRRGRYHASGALLAISAGCPVVPLAHNAGHYWPVAGWRLRPGCVRLVIGDPIATRGRKPREVMAEVEAWIEQQVAELSVGLDHPGGVMEARDPVSRR